MDDNIDLYLFRNSTLLFESKTVEECRRGTGLLRTLILSNRTARSRTNNLSTWAATYRRQHTCFCMLVVSRSHDEQHYGGKQPIDEVDEAKD